jgi:hypothetical protein
MLTKATGDVTRIKSLQDTWLVAGMEPYGHRHVLHCFSELSRLFSQGVLDDATSHVVLQEP